MFYYPYSKWISFVLGEWFKSLTFISQKIYRKKKKKGNWFDWAQRTDWWLSFMLNVIWIWMGEDGIAWSLKIKEERKKMAKIKKTLFFCFKKQKKNKRKRNLGWLSFLSHSYFHCQTPNLVSHSALFQMKKQTNLQ